MTGIHYIVGGYELKLNIVGIKVLGKTITNIVKIHHQAVIAMSLQI